MNMSCKSETIVIVDDEQEIADLLEVYLKNESYVVRKFYNPLDALACIEKEPGCDDAGNRRFLSLSEDTPKALVPDYYANCQNRGYR